MGDNAFYHNLSTLLWISIIYGITLLITIFQIFRIIYYKLGLFSARSILFISSFIQVLCTIIYFIILYEDQSVVVLYWAAFISYVSALFSFSRLSIVVFVFLKLLNPLEWNSKYKNQVYALLIILNCIMFILFSVISIFPNSIIPSILYLSASSSLPALVAVTLSIVSYKFFTLSKEPGDFGKEMKRLFYYTAIIAVLSFINSNYYLIILISILDAKFLEFYQTTPVLTLLVISDWIPINLILLVFKRLPQQHSELAIKSTSSEKDPLIKNNVK